MSKCVYMEITLDEYELPVAVADSVVELAKLIKISADTIYNVMYHNKVRGLKRCKYIKVELEEASDETT